GRWVEMSLGRFRYLVMYLGAGTAAFAIMLRLQQITDEQLLVGASANIMGVIGASVALVLIGALRNRSLPAKPRLIQLGAIVVLQVACDQLIPQVSGTAHLWGVSCGFLLAAALAPRKVPV